MGKPAKKSLFIIDPRKSKRIGYWDGLTGLALVYTAIVTPAEVALFEPATSFLEPLFMINRCVDVIFAYDMLVQFCLMVELQTGDAASKGTVWVSHPGRIAKNYIKTWFFLDLASIIVSAFDFMGFAFVIDILGDGADSLAKLKILRVLRVLRLVKLIRLVRASRMLKRWEQRYAVNYSLLSLSKAVTTVCLMGHWFACVWVLQAKIQTNVDNTWLYKYNMCNFPEPTVAADGTITAAAVDGPITCPPLETYMTSLYFSTMTITSIGYGDITPTMTNWLEQLMGILLMLTASVVWCQMIGVFAGVISSFNPEQNEFRATMDELNRFIAREQLDAPLAGRMRGYFHVSKHLRAQKQQQRLMSAMPPTLQGEVSWATNSTWLSNIWFLQGCDAQFMLELSQQMHAVVFSPSDLAPDGYLFIIQRGIALFDGKVLTKGGVFGTDMILADVRLRSKASARAMNYLEANYISRVELLMIAKRYPMTSKLVRRCAILLNLRREVVRLAAYVLDKRANEAAEKAGRASPTLGKKQSTMVNMFSAIDQARAAEMRGDIVEEKKADGGRLEGHTNDVGVQFEIVGEEITQIKAALAAQASEVEEMRKDSKQIIAALQTLVLNSSSNVMGGHHSSSKRALSTAKQLSYLHDPLQASLRVEHPPVPAAVPSVSTSSACGHAKPMNGHAKAINGGGGGHTAEDRTQDGQWQADKGAPSPPEQKAERKRRHRSRKGGADPALEA